MCNHRRYRIRTYLSVYRSIMTFGTEDQKKKYVVPLAKGEKLGAFGLTEPGAGTDAQGCQTEGCIRRRRVGIKRL